MTLEQQEFNQQLDNFMQSINSYERVELLRERLRQHVEHHVNPCDENWVHENWVVEITQEQEVVEDAKKENNILTIKDTDPVLLHKLTVESADTYCAVEKVQEPEITRKPRKPTEEDVLLWRKLIDIEQEDKNLLTVFRPYDTYDTEMPPSDIPESDNYFGISFFGEHADIYFWIDDCTLYMKITRMDERFRSIEKENVFKSCNNFDIRSKNFPAIVFPKILKNRLYLEGKFNAFDNKIVRSRINSQQFLFDYLEKALAALVDWDENWEGWEE